MSKKRPIAVFIRGFHNGGIEKVFETYFTHMDLSEYDIHVVTHMANDSTRKAIFEELGCTIHEFSRLRGSKLTRQNLKEYKELFGRYNFDIVHNNMPDNMLPLLFAKAKKVPIRILHAHNVYIAALEKRLPLVAIVYKMGFFINAAQATVLIGVSEDAAISTFGRKNRRRSIILPNAIEVHQFEYDEAVRKTVRKRMGLEGSLCIGHVGRYESDVKNQEFLLDILFKLKVLRPEAKLLLIGDGPKRVECEARAHELGLDDSVSFLGAVPNVCDYLQAMDVFVLPSRKEGLGIVAVEAQASGLRCLLSDRVPHEAKILDDVEFLSIDQGVDEWVEKIAANVAHSRTGAAYAVINAGYDIDMQANKLAEIYAGIE